MIDAPIAVVPAPEIPGETITAPDNAGPAWKAPDRTLLPAPAERKRVFAAEYLKDRNSTQAAIRTGYSPRSARNQGNRMMQDDDVVRLIAEGDAARALRVNVEADDILRDLDDLRRADPRELVEYRVDSCRHCHGAGHRYQRTPAERDKLFREWSSAEGLAEHVRTRRRLGLDGNPDVFDEAGGSDFDPNRPPSPDCPECFGRGIGRNIVKDQRTLSRQARRLLAGVRQTKDGVEVKMHDPIEAMQLAGRHLGMWKDNLDLTSNGKALPPATINVVLVRSTRERPDI